MKRNCRSVFPDLASYDEALIHETSDLDKTDDSDISADDIAERDIQQTEEEPIPEPAQETVKEIVQVDEESETQDTVLGDLKIYEEEDSGDIVVETSDTIWLQEMKSLFESTSWMDVIDFSDGTVSAMVRLQFYGWQISFEEDSQGNLSSFRIPENVILASHVPSGVVTMELPSVSSYEAVSFTFEDLKACKEIPDGLMIENSSEGLKIYFEEITDENRQFLKDLTIETKNSSHGGVVYQMGSEIILQNPYHNEYSMNAYNQVWIYDDGSQRKGKTQIIVSQDGNYALIPVGVLQGYSESNSCLLNGLTYDVSVNVYGYSGTYSVRLDELTCGRNAMPDNFEMNASIDTNGDIRIYANNDDWLEEVAQPQIEDGKGVVSYGGRLELIVGNSWMSFSNSINSYNNERYEYELKTDENGQKYICLSKKTLIEALSRNGFNSIKNEKISFRFYAYGYANYQSDPEKEGEYIVFEDDLVKQMPEFTIVETQEGDIKLSGSGEDYVAFANAFAGDYDAYISLYGNNTELAANFFDKYYRSQYKLTLDDDGTITIPNEMILEFGMPCGEVRVSVHVTGYTNYESTMDLMHACQPAPLLSARFTAEDGLVISCEDPKYLDAFFAVSQPYIRLIIGSSWKYYLYGSGIQRTNSGINVPAQTLIAAAVEDGTYTVQIDVNGYERTRITGIEIKDLLKTIDFDIDVSFEEGNLVIECENDDYLDAIMKESIHTYEDGKWTSVNYSSINIYNADKKDNKFGRGYTYYNDVTIKDGIEIDKRIYLVRNKNRITIDRELLLGDDLYFDNDTTQVRITAFGYPEVTKKDLSVVGARERYVPEELNVFCDENGDLVITSRSEQWLQDLCEIYSNFENQRHVGGSIRFVQYNETDGWDSYTRDIYNYGDFSYSSGKVIISNDVIKNKSVMNGEYYIILRPRNYMPIETADPVMVTGGIDELPDDIEVSLNGQKDLVISSKNTEWMSALADHKKSDVLLYNDSVNYSAGPAQMEYKDGSVVIDKDFFTFCELKKGTYSIELSAYGYVTKESSIELDDYVKSPEGVSVFVKDGSLIIMCDEPEYLTALAREEELPVSQEDIIRKGGMIHISYDSFDDVGIANTYDTDKDEHTVYFSVNDGSIVIDNDTLINLKVKNSQSASIILKAFGYETIRIDDVVIRDAIEMKQPEDVEVNVLENGDLIIDCDDEDWLKALCEENAHEATPAMTGGKLIFNTDGNIQTISNTAEEIFYYFEDGKVIFPAENQIKARLYNGTKKLKLLPYKYSEYKNSFEIILTEGYRLLPEGITAELSDGDLHIRCDDERWKKTLTEDIRSSIRLKDEDNEFVFSIEDLSMNEAGDIVISEYKISEKGVTEGLYTLYVNAYGYDGFYQNDTKIAYTLKTLVKAAQDVSSNDILITSSVMEWLNETAELSSGRIRFVSDEDYYVEFGTDCDKDYVRMDKDEEGNIIGLRIMEKGLLASHIPSFEGMLMVEFPATESYDGFRIWMDGFTACRKAPEGLKVEESPEGLRFYFEETDQQTKEFLSAMLKDEVKDHSISANGKVTKGSSIDIYHIGEEKYSDLYAINQTLIDKDGNEEKKEDQIILSEDATYVLIPIDEVKASRLIISEETTYKAEISVYGYESCYDSEETALEFKLLQYANRLVQGDVFVETYDKASKEQIVITADDETWIRKFGTEGGKLSFIPIEDSGEYREFVFDASADGLYRYDEERKALVFDSLIDNDIMNGVYHLDFELDWYVPYSYEGPLTVLNGNKPTPKDLSVTLNDKKDIVITPIDEGFIECMMNEPRSYIALHDDTQTTYFYSGEYEVVDASIVIDSLVLAVKGVSENEYELQIRAYGYSPDYWLSMQLPGYEDVVLVHYNVVFNANGGKGKMEKQSVVSDVNMHLQPNLFSRATYTFIGWSTKKNGKVEYKDEAYIKRHFDSAGSLTLYAVWEPIKAREIKIIGPSNIAAGKSIALKTGFLPEDTNNKKVKWTSSDTDVLTVSSSGKVTAKKGTEGKNAVIKAEALDGSEVYCEYPVNVLQAVTKVNILYEGKDYTAKTIGVEMGEEAILELNASNDPDGSSQEVIWSSSKPKLAAVDENGKVTIIGTKGTVKITAKAADGSNKNASVTLNIARLVNEIEISGPTQVAAGKSVTLKANVLPTDAGNKKLTWKSSDTSVATVSSSGKVTAKKNVEGKTVIITASAKDGSEISSSYEVTVTSPVTKVEILYDGQVYTGKAIGVEMGEETILPLSTVSHPDGSSQDVTWISSKPKLATVDTDGKVTIFGTKGTVKITAKASDGSGKSASVTLNVAKLVKEIEISGVQDVAAGKSVTLKASILPTDAGNKKLTWISSDTSVATVSSSGKVTAKKQTEGRSVTIRAEAKDGSGICDEFEVLIHPLATSVILTDEDGNPLLNNAKISIYQTEGKTYQLTAGALPEESIQIFKWSSSDKKIASVDADGLVHFTGKKGTVKITAIETDGSGKKAVVSFVHDENAE